MLQPKLFSVNATDNERLSRRNPPLHKRPVLLDPTLFLYQLASSHYQAGFILDIDDSIWTPRKEVRN